MRCPPQSGEHDANIGAVRPYSVSNLVLYYCSPNEHKGLPEKLLATPPRFLGITLLVSLQLLL